MARRNSSVSPTNEQAAPANRTGVYQWRNLVNGKVYVGSSGKSLDGRRDEHLFLLRGNCHFNCHLQRAWNKYGEHQFVFEVLEECPKDQSLLREQWWIDAKQAADGRYGYNRRPVAGSNLGIKYPKRTRDRNSQAQKKKWADPAHRTMMVAIHTQRYKNPANLAKAKQSHNTPEAKKSHSDAMKRVLSDPAMREKYARGQKKKWAKDGYRERMCAIQKDMWNRPERRSLRSQQAKETWADPEIRARRLAAARKLTESDVRRIRRMYSRKQRTQIELALNFGVTTDTIRNVIYFRRAYAEVR